MKNGKKILTGLSLVLALGIALWNQGCKGTIPSTATMAVNPIPTCMPLLVHGFESLTENGTLTPANASMALYPLYATQGSSSLDIHIMTATNYNIFLSIFNLTPTSFKGYSRAVLDITVDPSILVGGTYHQLVLVGDDSGAGTFVRRLSSGIPTLVAGSQSVTWTLDYPDAVTDNFTANSTITGVRFVFNNDSSPNGLGHLYIDNFRLLCP